MAYSENKCQSLADQIAKLEQSLNDYLTGDRALTVQDGTSMVGFQAGSQIPQQIRARIAELKAQYAKGSCALVLGNDDIDTAPRRGLRPVFRP